MNSSVIRIFAYRRNILFTFRFIPVFCVTTTKGLNVLHHQLSQTAAPSVFAPVPLRPRHEHTVCSDWSALTRLSQHRTEQLY